MKHAILALLTQGPAYGLQVRNEIDRRLGRERAINVGQVYATIERLVRDDYARVHSHTPDGLPLYALTPTGEAVAHAWLSAPAADQTRPWEAMVSQVLMATSLPGIDASELITAYVHLWRVRKGEAASADTLGSRSRLHIADAALTWLAEVEAAPDMSVAVSRQRPPKGRPRAHVQ